MQLRLARVLTKDARKTLGISKILSDYSQTLLLSPRLKHDSMLCLNLSHVFPQHQPRLQHTDVSLADPPQKRQRRVGRKTHDSSTCHWGTDTRYAPRLF